MDKICAIIDAQGFIINGKFHIRELAFNEFDSPNVLNWEFDIPYNFEELNTKDKITNDYIMRNITGLPFQPQRDSKYMTFDKLRPFIGYLYQKTQTTQRKFFGIKSQQIAEVLFDLDIPFILLGDIPSVKRLQKYYKTTAFCTNHTENYEGKCAEQKVEHIRRWISDTQYFNNEFSI